MTEAELDERLSRPTPGVIEVLRRLPGDLLILGAGGKMGPTLAMMARRAAAPEHRVIAVSRFSDQDKRHRLDAAGISTVGADLQDRAALDRLPDAAALVFMAGHKFGTDSAPHGTWAMNAIVPALIADRFAGTRTVVFSSGNIYPLTPVAAGGPAEDHPIGPVGEYAMSCLARERIFEHAAARQRTPVSIVRLNYAIDLRYGVLVDTALRVRDRRPVPLAMGHVNVIWQGDANARALQCLALASTPATIMNVTGPETVSIRWLAGRFGERFGVPPQFEDEEAPTALLSNAARSIELFGPPTVGLEEMIDWTAQWLEAGGPLLGTATKFEVRDGRF
jgi:nucleoside-diphosphate-sugar epimerase